MAPRACCSTSPNTPGPVPSRSRFRQRSKSRRSSDLPLARPQTGRETSRLRLDLEANALRQRQCARIVDGRGHPAHVGLPRIATGLAPAAGFLLATEGAANLGAARPDIDIDDAAIAALGRGEQLGFAQICGEDAGGE